MNTKLNTQGGLRDGGSPATRNHQRRSPALDTIFYKISFLRRLIEHEANPAILKTHKITIAEWRVLCQLYSKSAITATQLSACLSTDKAEVSRACSSLVAGGHASARTDPDDKRVTHLRITRKGEQLHDRVLPLRRALQADLASALTATENRAFARALDKLIEHMIAKPEVSSSGESGRDRPRRANGRQVKSTQSKRRQNKTGRKTRQTNTRKTNSRQTGVRQISARPGRRAAAGKARKRLVSRGR